MSQGYQDLIVHPETGENLRFRLPWMREHCVTVIKGESMTHQSHAETCDINRIVATYAATGILPEGRTDGQYGDVTGLQGDLTESINQSWQTLNTLQERIEGEKREKREAAEAQRKKDEEDLARYRSQSAGSGSAPASGSEAAAQASG